MIGWYPPLNDSSDLTWHMFTHVVETNQHSLHDIYVHGGLYPTHACTLCSLILMHVHDRYRSIVGRFPVFFSPSPVLRGNTACASNPLTPKVIPYESTIPSYMRYLPAVPSKFCMCQTLNLQMKFCFVCLNSSCIN